MKRLRPVVFAIAFLVLLAGSAAISWKLYGDPHEQKGHLVLLGNIDVRQVTLAFKVPGRVQSVGVEEGDAVKVGQSVASLEKDDFEDEFHLAQAHLAGQQAVLAQLEKGTRTEEIEQARALVRQRQAALELARSTLKRWPASLKRVHQIC